MTNDIDHTTMVDGIKVEYPSWPVSGLGSGGMVYLEKYTPQCVRAAKKLGFKRVQIGTMGDFYYMNTKAGEMVALDTMYVCRFLKR